MLKFTDKRGNTIYAYQHPARLNIYIDFGSHSGCTVFLAGGAWCAGSSQVRIWGDNACLFVGDSVLGDVNLVLSQGACCYIGNRVFMVANARGQRIRVKGDKVVLLGDDCLLSEDIDIVTTDGHRIYDKDTCKWVSGNRSVFLGDHVWLGRSSSILKGSCISSGSMLGFGSVLAGRWIQSHAVAAGSPARVLAEDRIWSCENTLFSGEISATQQEMEKGTFEHDATTVIRPCNLEHTLKEIGSSHEKIKFLYDVLYLRAEHNRFAWNAEDVTAAADVVIPYGNSFERLLEETRLKEERWLSFPTFTQDEIRCIKLLALWKHRHWIWWQYQRCALMRRVTWGKKKRKYQEKKLHYRERLRRIEACKNMMQSYLR